MADGLDVVAVGPDDEGRVVVRVVLRAQAAPVVVRAAGGKPGGFSGNGGVDTKLRMLAIEGALVNYTPDLFA